MLWRLSRVKWGVEQEKAGLLLHADKVDFGSTMAPRGRGGVENGKGQGGGKAVAGEWTIRRISLALF